MKKLIQIILHGFGCIWEEERNLNGTIRHWYCKQCFRLKYPESATLNNPFNRMKEVARLTPTKNGYRISGDKKTMKKLRKNYERELRTNAVRITVTETKK